ncbi:CAP domain-containing protein [Thalassococcus sp. CAU 1522]|uniref:CAP domain-containing protein n=1 Tax=Thalassococcus arenae TaxID=2851652 RepID=A0ABS6N3E1_9RHOB|nr:CAP domain-containing protein [Thalassococcus arenae]
MLNGLRGEAGLAPLKPSPALEEAAMQHAMDMARNGFFSHTGSDGSTVASRVRAAGYGFCQVAENIAKGQESPKNVMRSWVDSAPHRKNLLLRDIEEYGLVRAPGDIWVLVLGRGGCGS